MEAIYAAVAELDNNIRKERWTEGMRQKLAKGCWMFSPPLGYAFGADPFGNKNLMDDKGRAPLLRWAFEEMATGSHQQSQVLKEGTKRGLRTRKNKKINKQSSRGCC